MKVRVKALKRGTVVAPATGHQVHFDPNAKRYPTARKPFVDERDVEYFVREGYAEEPDPKARKYGDDHVREIMREETHAPEDGEQAARRVANAAAADAKGGTANSGLDTRQTRNFDPASNPGQDVALEDEGGEGEEGGENDDGLDPADPDAPPAAGARRAAAPSAARPNPRRAAKKAAAAKS